MNVSSKRNLIAIAIFAAMAQGCSKEQPPAASSAPASEAQPAPAEAPMAAPAETMAAATPAETAPASSEAGAKVYKTYCETCHGPKGAGDGPAAMGLNPKPVSFVAGAFKFDPNGNGTKGELEDIQAVVRDGAAKYGGSPLMTPWSMLSADDLAAVAAHVKSLGGG